ncbi:GPP34 family phosphoprotein [Amycolatopsis carbonis]|uniref:GPP34 family phosphoprotein n=1 Tax=Amycolatopsis carbonis TaxID=715471 RepID=A0A9Y2I9E0_9PSEU|nr:GPP34 family phosphoprotein [Amycolatopsis sp. 2-15]WIX74856.1 GPP34 family phosphoprotein [Amycolatopsis sp. 2-15]
MTRSLAAQAYLLACDPDTGRIGRRSRAALLVRASAVTDLLLRGHLTVTGGRISATGRGPTGDLLLDDLLTDLTDTGPTGWRRLLRRDSGDTLHSLELQLAAAGILRQHVTPVLRRKVLRLDDRSPADAARATVDRALRAPLSEVDTRAAALTSLAAAAQVGFTRRSSHRHAARLAELDAAAGSAVPALRGLLRSRRAVIMSGGS